VRYLNRLKGEKLVLTALGKMKLAKFAKTKVAVTIIK
jgi:hypothetical protein